MTIKEALQIAKNLSEVQADFEGLWILEKITGVSVAGLHLADSNSQLAPQYEEQFLKMIEQRKNNVPLQYILGEWDFMGVKIKCRENVLIPRRDTEILVEETINYLKNSTGDKTLLDLCTGTGCIGIALARHFSHITFSDISSDAIALAKENAELNKIAEKSTFVQSDLFDKINGTFDCITVNPPYISEEGLKTLPLDVQKEPLLALDGGKDGLNFYRKIIPICKNFLTPNGAIFMEIGNKQGNDVRFMLLENGFSCAMIIKDLELRDRVVYGTLN
ncbi:MAG: peptide chain release factor N(5)-glutamine methyltransferase [Firmicutes bacterium]|nr:peptide chain release factor N(5)-glutamine methyltransferase [Bacillota bacterium]